MGRTPIYVTPPEELELALRGAGGELGVFWGEAALRLWRPWASPWHHEAGWRGALTRRRIGGLCCVALAASAAWSAPAFGQAPAWGRGPTAPSPRRPSRGTVRHRRGKEVVLHLLPGDELLIGTCGVEGAEARGDTTLSLRGPNGFLDSNDDACGALGSRITLRVPPGGGGTYVARAGCYDDSGCGGVLAWEVYPPGFSPPGRQWPLHLDGADLPSGLVPHVPGQDVLHLRLAPGHVVAAGTCGEPGAFREGDTTLSLLGPGGGEVASNDDACTGLGSRIEYQVPRDRGGVYRVRPGCFGSRASCGGRIGFRVFRGLPPTPMLRVSVAARGLVSPDGAGAALVADAEVEWRPVPELSLRLAGTPMGLGGGDFGGTAAGSVHLVGAVTFGDGYVELGAGGGVSVLASRIGGAEAQETGVFVAHARVGRANDVRVEGQLGVSTVEDEPALMLLRGALHIPTRDFELPLRGAGGNDGVFLGEAALLLWVAHDHGTPSLGVSVHAGGAGVFYQPVCRLAGTCEPRWYAGPTLGAGLQYRY